MRVKINMTSNLDISISKKVNALKSIFLYNILPKESEVNFKGPLVNFNIIQCRYFIRVIGS